MIGIDVATRICALACALLVVAEWRELSRLRIASKLVASAAFVAIGFQAAQLGHDPAGVAYGQWLLIGLVLGAVGDAALLGRGSRAFLAGLGAFLLGHLAYVAATIGLVPIGAWPTTTGIGVLIPVIAGGTALALLWPRLGSMRMPVIAYVIAIVAMVVGAIAVARAHALPETQRMRLVIGASLFFVSDLAVARDRFVARTFANKLWGLPAYYAGQLFIAWSLVGL